MKRITVMILIALGGLLCTGWGFLVHRTINQLAIYELPKSMRGFFFLNKDSVVWNAPRPDIRRGSDPLEASRHFIDLEAFGDSAAWKMPRRLEDALLQFGKDSLLKYGYVPYHILFIKDRLSNAFRLGQRDSILYYAADLAHYIGDAHVPLHTTTNYDGQLSNQRGIHDLWETSVPEISLDHYLLSSRHHAEYLDDPAEAIWQSIRQAHELLPAMFAMEKEISQLFTDSTKYVNKFRWGKNRRFYSPDFAKAYNSRMAGSINSQLILSANQVADFWYTAWVDAGSPDLSMLTEGLTDRKQRKEMRKERRAFRRNQLVPRHLLIAKRTGDN